MKKIIILIIFAITLSGCEILTQILEQSTTSVAPTDQEVVSGLKKALEEGTKFAVSNLNKKDGYYGNTKVKIPLPDDVKNVINVAINNNTVKNLGFDKVLQQKIDNFELAINRAAEDAAQEALPIFINSVNNLSISQGMNILRGTDLSGQHSGFDSLAATHYLEMKSRPALFTSFQPKMDNVLNKDLGLGFSANDAWNKLITYYNGIIVPVLGKEKITYTLSEYATNKALDGLFYMMGNEEKEIRENPYKFAYDIIKKVFGYVFKPQN